MPQALGAPALRDASLRRRTQRVGPYLPLPSAHNPNGDGRLGLTLTRTAEGLEASAALADEHAERHERAGRSDDAAKERRAAQHAREATQRARLRAGGWLGLSVDRKSSAWSEPPLGYVTAPLLIETEGAVDRVAPFYVRPESRTSAVRGSRCRSTDVLDLRADRRRLRQAQTFGSTRTGCGLWNDGIPWSFVAR